MALLDRLRLEPSRSEWEKLFPQWTARFGRLLWNYGRILDLMEDAAEKQGEQYILDGRYIHDLSEGLFNLAKAVIFDTIILSDKHHLWLLDLLERFEDEGDRIVALGENARQEEGASADPPASSVSAKDMASAIAGHKAIYRDAGRVAARGIASGKVFNLAAGDDPKSFPDGGVWVAPDQAHATDLIGVMNKVGAVLLDKGSPSDYVCRLTRNSRIPTIVGLKDAAERLKSGTLVTVDTEENVVYEGEIPELVAYFREREGTEIEEEMEYSVLRRFRRRLFPLTLGNARDHLPGPDDVGTFHDLVHLAHELAGEALVKRAMNRRALKRNASPMEAGLPYSIMTLNLEMEGEDGPSQTMPESPALKAFLRGLGEYEKENNADKKETEKGTMVVSSNGKRTNIIMPSEKDFDMVDSYIDKKELNHVYCRFDSRTWDLEQKFARPNAALEILTRLDFAATQTNRAVAAWSSRLDGPEAERKMAVLGRLFGFLKNGDLSGWSRVGASERIDGFIKKYAQQ